MPPPENPYASFSRPAGNDPYGSFSRPQRGAVVGPLSQFGAGFNERLAQAIELPQE